MFIYNLILSLTLFLFILQQAYNAIAVSRQMKLLALASSNRNSSTSESSCERKTAESAEVSASEYLLLIETIRIYNKIDKIYYISFLSVIKVLHNPYNICIVG